KTQGPSTPPDAPLPTVSDEAMHLKTATAPKKRAHHHQPAAGAPSKSEPLTALRMNWYWQSMTWGTMQARPPVSRPPTHGENQRGRRRDGMKRLSTVERNQLKKMLASPQSGPRRM